MITAVGKGLRALRLTGRSLVRDPRAAVLRARMAGWILVISVLARLTSLPRAQRLASAGVRPRPAGRASFTPAELAQAIDSVLSLDLFVFRRSCWKRAMVLQRFLSRDGIESRINFGLQKTGDGTITGHAWLEHDGRTILERDSGTYVVTFTLPREEARGRARRAS